MPKGSRIVDIQGVVHDVENFTVAYQGEAKVIGRALVAEFGIAREFWPPTTTPGTPIVMDTDTELSYDIDPQGGTEVPLAICNFDARTGRLILSSPDGTEQFIQVLNPAPRAQDLFVFKVDQVSGTISGTLGVWIDVLSETTIGVFEYSVTNTTGVVSTVLGEATFTIAQDDGAGGPAVGTEVAKTIDFKAELTGVNLSWTEVPWLLEDITINENASCVILIGPGVGNAYATGNEHGIERTREIYAQIWNDEFTVQVDVVSGALTGGADTGVELPTDVIQVWGLDTFGDNDLDAVVDMTISDGTSSVTKRITMHSQQTSDNGDSDISTDFIRFDRLIDNAVTQLPAPINEALALILVQNDGLVNAQVLQDPPGGTQTFPQNWNDSAPTVPDPENFEAKLHVVTGDAPQAFSDPLDIFLSLDQTRSWGLNISAVEASGTEETFKSGTYELTIQESGRPETAQIKTFEMIVESIVIPEGGLP